MAHDTFPVLFIGHGSPMNIIADNPYTRDLRKYGAELPVPDAILVVSAHWLTDGTHVTGGAMPEQIYDFYGFPKELYGVKYRAPGSKEIATLVASVPDGIASVQIDERRGIDHAAWAPLSLLYPEQNIPVLEMSIDIYRPPRYHFELGKRLARLRTHRVLVIGSGNIVHNLGDIDWNENAKPYKWASEFDGIVKEAILSKYFTTLIEYEKLGDIAAKAVPTNDHYLPMLYVLGMMASDGEAIAFFHESIQNGSVSMRCFRIG